MIKIIRRLNEVCKNTVVPQVEKVQGISSVSVSGEQVEEAELVFKQDKLKQLGLDEDTVKKLIKHPMQKCRLVRIRWMDLKICCGRRKDDNRKRFGKLRDSSCA